MKIEIPMDDYHLFISNDLMDNDNYVEMWFEEKRSKHDDEDKEYVTFPTIEPLTVPIDDLLKAISIFKKYE
jgi:hypothetical protein